MQLHPQKKQISAKLTLKMLEFITITLFLHVWQMQLLDLQQELIQAILLQHKYQPGKLFHIEQLLVLQKTEELFILHTTQMENHIHHVKLIFAMELQSMVSTLMLEHFSTHIFWDVMDKVQTSLECINNALQIQELVELLILLPLQKW